MLSVGLRERLTLALPLLLVLLLTAPDEVAVALGDVLSLRDDDADEHALKPVPLVVPVSAGMGGGCKAEYHSIRCPAMDDYS